MRPERSCFIFLYRTMNGFVTFGTEYRRICRVLLFFFYIHTYIKGQPILFCTITCTYLLAVVCKRQISQTWLQREMFHPVHHMLCTTLHIQISGYFRRYDWSGAKSCFFRKELHIRKRRQHCRKRE